jgi:hypothetical protein
MGYQARCLQIGRADAIARTCEAEFDEQDPIRMRELITISSRSLGCKVRKVSSTPGRLVLVPHAPEPLMSPALRSLDWLDPQMESRIEVRGWQKFPRGE